MNNFFQSTAFQFTTALFALLCFLIISGNMYKKKIFSIKTLTATSLSIALAVILSYIKIEMPYGGSMSICRMFFISVVGYWFGPACGILAGVTYSFIDFTLAPHFYTPVQMILDYPLAFGMLGLSGFFRNKKYGLQIGFMIGVFGRFICSVISGVVFFYEYTPIGMNPLIYSLVYNGSYIFGEAFLTLIIINIPQFKMAINNIKNIAVNN